MCKNCNLSSECYSGWKDESKNGIAKELWICNACRILEWHHIVYDDNSDSWGLGLRWTKEF